MGKNAMRSMSRVQLRVKQDRAPSTLRNVTEAFWHPDGHGLSHVEPSLEAMRMLAGVSDEEKLTIDVEELGVTPPSGFQPKPIRW